MAFPQPYFHGLHIMATWDGEINHALDLHITLNIKALPNSRLRLISLEAACHAEMTGLNERSPATTYTGGGSTFQVDEDREVEQAKGCRTPSVITDLNLDVPSINYISRIPLPVSSRGSSPQKRPIPIIQRSPWPAPASVDATESLGSSSKIGGRKSIASHSADGSCSPTKSLGKNFRVLDPARRGREPLRAKVSRKASHNALSGHRTREGTPEQKVTEWLDQNDHEPNIARAIIPEYSTEDYRSEERLDSPSVINTAEEHETFLPSPSPSSQVSFPWASARYRNPLRLRGAGSCAASIEKINGCFYAVFPTNVTEVVHRVQIRARVSLRKDSDRNGHFLEIPGLPTQDLSEGCFSLLIIGDDESGCPNYMKVAHVDKNSHTKVFMDPQFETAFNVDAPFSIKLLRFVLDGVQELKETDFEIDYDVQTSSNLYLIVCSFRLHEFLFWANHLRIKMFIAGGPFGVIRAEPVNGGCQNPIVDQCRNCQEREVTVTMRAAEITTPLAFICESATETVQTWAPRICRSRRLAEDVPAQRKNIAEVHATVVEMFRRPEHEISEVTSTYLTVRDIPLPEESNDRVVQISPPRITTACVRSLWHVIKLLFMAYFIAFYVTTRFELGSESFEEARGKFIDSVYNCSSELASKMSEQPLWHNIGVRKEILQQIGEDSEEQDKTPQLVVEEDLDEKEDEAETYEPGMRQGLTLRDKIDRALGWKGPIGDW